MTRSLRAPFLLFSLALLVACAGPKYEQDYKPETNFGAYQRYDWRGGQSQIPGFGRERLQQVAERALAAQGYQRDSESPQLYIDVSALTRPATGGGKSLGISIGLPVGSRGSVGVGGSKSLDNQNQEGVLIVDISEADSRELIWRGSAAGIPLKDFELRWETQLRQVLDKLLSRFPPE